MKITITIKTGTPGINSWTDIMGSIQKAVNERPIRCREDQYSPSPLSANICDWNGVPVGKLKVEEDTPMTPEEEAEEAGRRG